MNPDSLTALAAMPLQLQLIGGAGYCAYLFAYIGIRHAHSAGDTVFSSLAFGLVAAIVLLLPLNLPMWAHATIAFALTLSAGVAWRLFVRVWLRNALRKFGYSWADDTQSAWDHMLECTERSPTQLTVELDDGRYLMCSDAFAVKDRPFGPYVLGTNGDVLLYVDKTEYPGEKPQDQPRVHEDGWGSLITYVPRDRIRKIAIRYV